MESLPDGVIEQLREAIVAPDFTATRYELLGDVGGGGMGTVYAAMDKQLNRRVALKVLNISHADREDASQMAEEARILARLEHPGIVPVHDLGELPDGRMFYAMKLVEGQRLDRYLDAATGVAEILRVFLRICETVAFAHAHGIIHRDLKPQNIMVGPFGEVLVLDWGVAKTAGDRAAAAGTPGYMAPEQESGIGEVGERSDIYSLGKTLAVLLENGRCEVPPRLRAVCEKAASASPDQRYASVVELAHDIERLRSGEPILAYRETLVERFGRLLARNRTLVTLVATYLVMRAFLFFLFKR